MKKFLAIIALLCTVAVISVIPGCGRQQSETVKVDFDNEAFNLELSKVYQNLNSFNGITRAYDPTDPEQVAAYLEEIEVIIEWLQQIAEEYNIPEVVAASPYYNNMEMLGDITIGEMTDGELALFLDANATPEFKRMYAQTAAEISQYGAEYVIENSDLLPNEKLAWVAVYALIMEDGAGITRSSSDCYNDYLRDIDRCKKKAFRGAALSVAIVLFGGGPAGGTIAVIGTMFEYAECIDDAKYDYDRCLRQL